MRILYIAVKKTLEEAGDKAEDSEKEAIERGIEDLEAALKEDNKEIIDEKIKVLSEASSPLAQRLYEEKAKENQAEPQNEATNDSEAEAVDADFEEVKEEK